MHFPEEKPALTTPRLHLRLYEPPDAAALRPLIDHPDVACWLASVPQPYPADEAEKYIIRVADGWAKKESVGLAIFLQNKTTFIGGIGLRINVKHDWAELGYWLGQPYWNQGYATEAARAVLRYGFDILGLHRIMACHHPDNAASKNILLKLNMKYEGFIRGNYKKNGQFEDSQQYAILAIDK